MQLLAGPGERREDCRRYRDCLFAFVRAHPRGEPSAHCVPRCRFFEPIPRHAAIELGSPRDGTLGQ